MKRFAWGTARHNALLAGIALVAGLAMALLPAPLAGALLVGVILVVLIAIEPVVGLVITLAAGPLKTLIATEAPYDLPLDVGQIALAATIGAWFAHKTLHKPTRHLSLKAINPVFPPLLVFIFVSALSIIDAASTSAGVRELLKWIEVALIAAITLDLIRSDARRLRWIVWAALAAGTGHALIGLYEFFGGSGADHLAITIAGRTFYRAFGSFGQPNPFAGFMGIGLTLALGTVWGSLRERAAIWQPVVYTVVAVLLAGALVASWSRGAWMGVAAASMVMALFLPRNLWRGVLLVGGLALLFTVVWASGKLPGAIVERITDFTDIATGLADVRGVDIDTENYAEIERFAHWQAAVSMAESRPWLGVGFGNYPVAYPAHALMNWPEPLGHAHNYYLNTLAETGIIGLAAYLFMGAAVVRLTIAVLRRRSICAWERGVALGLLGVWSHLAIHSVLDKLYVNNVFLHIGVLLGILAALHEDKTGILSKMEEYDLSAKG